MNKLVIRKNRPEEENTSLWKLNNVSDTVFLKLGKKRGEKKDFVLYILRLNHVKLSF